MSKQRITIGANGVVRPGDRMRLPSGGEARDHPAIKLTRLHQLLRTRKPKICVIRGEGIGDVITATPTVRGIKHMFENAEITFATNTRYLNGALVKVLKYNPDIAHIIERDLINNMSFDLIVNLHCPAIKFEKPRQMPPSRIDIFAQHAGVKLDDPVPRFYIQKDEIESGEFLLRTITSQEKLVLVQPSANDSSRSVTQIQKRIKEALIRLYQDYGIRSMILAHSSDGRSDVLWDNIPGSIFVKDLDIRGIAGVMVHCNLVLCPDSSILHLAGALRVPTVGLFGPSPPQSRINHYANAVGIWEGHDIPACPCVVGDSIVLTKDGYKEIKDIQIGDTVKTVDSSWNKVTKTHKNPRNDRKLISLKPMGFTEPIVVTEDHKMLCVTYPHNVFRKSRFVPNREWVKTKDLKENKSFLCIPRNQYDKKLDPEISSEEAWMLGLYAAEGSHISTKRGSISFIINQDEKHIVEKIRKIVDTLYLNSTVGFYPSKVDGSAELEIYNRSLTSLYLDIWKDQKSQTKTVPHFMFRSSDAAIREFLDGYYTGDGYNAPSCPENQKVTATASRLLAYGIQELYTRLGQFAKVYKCKQQIGGLDRLSEKYKSEDHFYYRVDRSLSKAKRSYIVDNEYIYIPVKEIKESNREDEFVYDITVENSTTFCIQNLATWDCFYESCPTGYSCWERITTQMIVEKCVEHLNNSNKVDILRLLDNIQPMHIKTEII